MVQTNEEKIDVELPYTMDTVKYGYLLNLEKNKDEPIALICIL